MSEIAVSDILSSIVSVGFLKVKPKVNKRPEPRLIIAYLFAFRLIPNTKTWNTQFKIWNTQLRKKEMGKYPIASNPYLELCVPDSILQDIGFQISSVIQSDVWLHKQLH